MTSIARRDRPFRIVHVSNFGRKPKGAALHAVAPKLSNGLIRNGHYVYNFDDRDVARAGTIFGSRKFGVGAANRALTEFCDHFGPEILVLGHADVIRPDTIAKLRARNPHLKVVQWNVDPLFEAGNVGRINAKLGVVDMTLITTGSDDLKQFARPGNVVGFLPNMVDPSIERGQNFARDDLEFDLLYVVGNPKLPRHHCGKVCNVDDLAQQIERAVPNLKTGLFGMRGQRGVTGARYQAVLENARLGLNLSRRNDVYLYSSDRMAHYMGNGILTLVERATGFGDLFDEDEIAFYGDERELADKLRFFLANDGERRRIAERGWRKYHRLFDCAAVARYMIDAIDGRLDPTPAYWRARAGDV